MLKVTALVLLGGTVRAGLGRRGRLSTTRGTCYSWPQPAAPTPTAQGTRLPGARSAVSPRDPDAEVRAGAAMGTGSPCPLHCHQNSWG